MENHLYECLYDILRSNAPGTEKMPVLQRNKAKLVRLHAERGNKALLDTKEHDNQQVTDEHGNTHSTFRDVAATFMTHMSRKYLSIVGLAYLAELSSSRMPDGDCRAVGATNYQ